MRGAFDLASRQFNAEVSVNYGRSKAIHGQCVGPATVRQCGKCRNAAAQIVCNTAVTAATNAAPGGFLSIADTNCVPLNLFGEGRATQAALDYVTVRTVTDTSLDQFVLNANLGGSFFDIWGGPVAFNVGYEHREEGATFDPDPFLIAGYGRSVAILPIEGSFDASFLWTNELLPNTTGVAPQRADTLAGDPEYAAQANITHDNEFGGIFGSVNFQSATFPSLTAAAENSQFLRCREIVFRECRRIHKVL